MTLCRKQILVQRHLLRWTENEVKVLERFGHEVARHVVRHALRCIHHIGQCRVRELSFAVLLDRFYDAPCIFLILNVARGTVQNEQACNSFYGQEGEMTLVKPANIELHLSRKLMIHRVDRNEMSPLPGLNTYSGSMR